MCQRHMHFERKFNFDKCPLFLLLHLSGNIFEDEQALLDDEIEHVISNGTYIIWNR